LPPAENTPILGYFFYFRPKNRCKKSQENKWGSLSTTSLLYQFIHYPRVKFGSLKNQNKPCVIDEWITP